MKGVFVSFAIAAVVVCGFLSCVSSPAGVQAASSTAITDEFTSTSIQFVTIFSQNDYPRLSSYFNDDVKKALTEDKFKQVWPTVVSMFGEFRQVLGTTSTIEAGKKTVIVHCRFSKQDADIKLVFDSQKLIGGFWISKSQEAAIVYKPPAYINTASFSEKDVLVGSGEWTLPGTLTIPNGVTSAPAVVLVAGSGPNDRDETVGPNKPFKDMAWGLASRGIVVLRYEKRTKQYAAKMIDFIKDLTVKEEVIDDAVSAVGLLKMIPNVDPKAIYVLGHSLGGMLIPRIGEALPDAAGLVILAGPTRPLEDLVVEQTNYIFSLNGGPTEDQKKQMAEISAQVAEVKDPHLSDHPKDEVILGAAPAYWLDLRSYNPTATAKDLTQRLLVLQGGRDYQVTTRDFNGWKDALGAQGNVSFLYYPDLNHLFIAGKGMSTPSEYESPGHVSAEVVTAIADWINRK